MSQRNIIRTRLKLFAIALVCSLVVLFAATLLFFARAATPQALQSRHAAQVGCVALLLALGLGAVLVRVFHIYQKNYERGVEHEARIMFARQTATLNAIVEAIPAMVAVWDSQLRYRVVNKAFERWRGRSRKDVIGRSIEEVAGRAEYEISLPWIVRAMAGETVCYEKEYPGAKETRNVAVTYMPLRLEDDSIGGIIAVAQDVTLDREERIRLLSLSERDPLTGLLNRGGFERFLKERVAAGQGASLAVLFIDLDHFKPINDTHGHAAGDDVLRAFSVLLQSLVRPTDAVARLGGDEFAIVLLGVRRPEDARMVADKVVQMARQPIITSGKAIKVGASVGVAFNSEREGGWSGLVARADAMAYAAKTGGRGRTVIDLDSRDSRGDAGI